MTWESQLLLSPGTAPGLSPEKPSTSTAACTSSVDRPRSHANLDRETNLNGGPAAAIAIYQSPGANPVSPLQAVLAWVAPLPKRFSEEELGRQGTHESTTIVTS